MSFDAFVKIDGIEGEATEDDHKNWIRVTQFEASITQPGKVTKSGAKGMAEGNADFSDFSFVKQLDISSPKLAHFCATGKHLGNVQIDLLRASDEGKKVKFMEYKYSRCYISGHHTSGGGEFPTEHISIGFEEVDWAYTVQDSAAGTPSGKMATGFSLTAGKGK